VYTRRIVLGGAAPAAVLAFGLFATAPAMASIGAPGLAAATGLVSSPTSELSSLTSLTGVAGGGLQGITSEVPAVSGLPIVSGHGLTLENGTLAPAVNAVTKPMQRAAQPATGPAGAVRRAGQIIGRVAGPAPSDLSGLTGQPGNASSGALGTLSTATSSVPVLGEATGALDGLGISGALPAAANLAGQSTPLGGLG
jgi:hypothetical protein